MPKVLFIGKGLDEYRRLLSGNGYDVVSCKTTSSAMSKLGGADCIVADKGHNDSLTELFKASKHIPKLVISHDDTFRGLAKWLKEPMSNYCFSPSEKELIFHVKKLFGEKKSDNEKKRLRKTIDLLTKELSFFSEINRTLTSSLELNEILVIIMKKVQAMTEAEAWSILLVDDETGELVFERAEGKVKKQMKKFRLAPGEGIAGWVAKDGKPLVVPDVEKDKRFLNAIDLSTNFTTKSIMCAPIMSKGNLLGVLELINKKNGESFTEEDLYILMKMVDQAALAVERAMLYQKMEELVITDDLTKLFNTRYLDRTIETEISRSKRYKTSVSLIFMDVDYFKDINDNYGHLIGSKVLVEMAQLLINCLRNLDIVARYGGDEFVLVLPQTAPNDAIEIAERIRKAIQDHAFLMNEGYNLRMTASFGVCSYPEGAKSKEELLRYADEAMYRVKHRTRNGVYAII